MCRFYLERWAAAFRAASQPSGSKLPRHNEFCAAAGVGSGSAIVPRGFCYGDIPLRIVFLFMAGLLSFGAVAAPGDIATLDRSTWPEQLNNPTLFDVASRAEILMFARVLLASESLDEPALADRLGLRTINLDSVNSLRERMWLRLLANYNFAQQSCDQDASFCFLVEDIPTLREQAAKFQVSDDSYYTKWAEPS